MLLENLVTRRVSEENVSNSSLTRRVTKQGYLLLGAVLGSMNGQRRRRAIQSPNKDEL